jgi:cell division protein FtsN
MKKNFAMFIGAFVLVAFTSCKSSESAYKKAYEKAKAQSESSTYYTGQTDNNTASDAVSVTPVQTVTTTTPTQGTVGSVSVRQDNVTLVSGSGLKTYSVICGSFSLQANAEGLQNTLKNAGYDAQVVYSPSTKTYRVAASTYDDKGAAVQSRETLRAKYPDAWLLLNQK